MDSTYNSWTHVPEADGNSMFPVKISRQKETGNLMFDLWGDCYVTFKQESDDDEEDDEEDEEEEEKEQEEYGLFSESREGSYIDWEAINKQDRINECPQDHVGKLGPTAIVVSHYPRKNKEEFVQKYKDMDDSDSWTGCIEDPDYDMGLWGWSDFNFYKVYK